MAQIAVTNITDGSTADAADVNSQINTIVSEFNGNIDNSNIKTGAAIATSKLATDAGIATGMIAAGAVTVAKRAGGFKVGTIAPGATGSLATTGVGFTPKLLITFPNPATDSAVTETGVGVTDGTSQWATASRFEQATPDMSGRSVTNKCLLAVTTNGAVVVDGSLTSFDADGFTINVTTRDAARTFGYIALG